MKRGELIMRVLLAAGWIIFALYAYFVEKSFFWWAGIFMAILAFSLGEYD